MDKMEVAVHDGHHIGDGLKNLSQDGFRFPKGLLGLFPLGDVDPQPFVGLRKLGCPLQNPGFQVGMGLLQRLRGTSTILRHTDGAGENSN